MANLSNINNILRTGSLGVGINRDPLGAFEISSATKPGIKMFNTATNGKTYEAYSDVNGNYIIYDQDADDNRLTIDSSGNATFAGSVTAAGTILSNTQLKAISSSGGVSGYFTDAVNSTLQIKHASGQLQFLNGSNNIWLTENGLQQVTFAGNVGIGISPSASFSGVEVLQLGKGMTLMGNSNDDRATMAANLYLDTGTAFRYVMDGLAGRFSIEDGNMIWGTAGSGTAGTVATVDTKMTLLNNGNLGIGTTNPLNRTHIVGPTLTTGTETTYGLAVSDVGDETKTLILGYDLVNDVGIIQAIDQQTAWKNLAFAISGNTKVGIGTTSPSKKLEVATTGINQSTTVRIQGTDGNGAGHPLDLKMDGAADSFSILIGQGGGATPSTVLFNGNRNGNVGIGTTSPSSYDADSDNLVVFDTANAGITIATSDLTGKSSIRFSDGTTGSRPYIGGIEYLHSDNSMRFDTEATEKMRIDSDGYLGIGTDSPKAKLDVQVTAGGAYQQWSYDSSGANNYFLQLNEYVTSGNVRFKFNQRNAGSDYPDVLVFNQGNVGIGTDEPYSTLSLEVSSATSTTGISTPFGITLQNTNTNNGNYTTIQNRDGNGDQNAEIKFFNVSHSLNRGAIAFSTRSSTSEFAEKMRITSGGDVLVQATSTGGNGLSIRPNATAGTVQQVFNRASTTSDSYVFDFQNGGTTVGFIRYDNTTTDYVTSSDYRLKENVVEMTGALDRVSQLKPSRFNFIADADKTVDGFLAHEVQEIVPEAITGEKDAVDEEGNPDYQGIDQSKLVPLLVGAIQELKADNDSLKARIETLENN